MTPHAPSYYAATANPFAAQPSLCGDVQADVVVIDATALNVAPVIDPVAAVVLCADVSNVETVMVDGVVRKRDGRLVADVDRARGLVESSRDHLVSAAAQAAEQKESA